MTSPKGERIPFPAPIRTRDARGCVEKWLIQVEENMRLSVRDIIDGGKDLFHIFPKTLCEACDYWSLTG